MLWLFAVDGVCCQCCSLCLLFFVFAVVAVGCCCVFAVVMCLSLPLAVVGVVEYGCVLFVVLLLSLLVCVVCCFLLFVFVGVCCCCCPLRVSLFFAFVVVPPDNPC